MASTAAKERGLCALSAQFTGEFANGFRSGVGTYKFKDGRVMLAEYTDDKAMPKYVVFSAGRLEALIETEGEVCDARRPPAQTAYAAAHRTEDLLRGLALWRRRHRSLLGRRRRHAASSAAAAATPLLILAL